MQISHATISTYGLKPGLIKKDNMETTSHSTVTYLNVTFFSLHPITWLESCVQKAAEEKKKQSGNLENYF